MSDLLSAASLFLAVLGLLYSAWYTEIRRAIDLPVPPHKQDRKPLIPQVRAAYYQRAVPLVVGAAAVSVILLPNVAETVVSSFHTYWTLGFTALKSYDSVNTLFCAIWAVIMTFTVHALGLAKGLNNKLCKLKES